MHDCADGGMLVAVAEMALASGIGAILNIAGAAQAFGEDQARYVVTGSATLLATARAAGIPAHRIGHTGGDAIVVGDVAVPLAALRAAHEGFFPALMGQSAV